MFWDQHYEVIPWTKDDDDMLLDEYSLPEAVENLIDAGKYKNVEQKVKKVRLKAIFDSTLMS